MTNFPDAYMRAVVRGDLVRAMSGLKRRGLYSQLFMRALRALKERLQLSCTLATMLHTLGYMLSGMRGAGAGVT